MASAQDGTHFTPDFLMRKCLFVAVLALAGLAVSSNRASAWWFHPTPGSAAFPMIYPSGYYTNTYYFAWYYPWYANYNYSHGWYANWWHGGGYAWYSGQQFPPGFVPGMPYPPPPPPAPEAKADAPKKDGPKKETPKKKDAPKKKKEAGVVAIQLPPDAKLWFNGVAAEGTGAKRTFVTPELEPGQEYEYLLEAEVIRPGQVMKTTASARVVVRAGEVTEVLLTPTATARK